MHDCHAVLLDTVSIQNYIFQSNKLKENLGASYLVQEIYRSYLACAFCPITGKTFEEELQQLDDWKHSDAEAPDGTKPVDVGYIGGGNALVFLQNAEQAQKFVEAWTEILLVQAPGLTTAVAHGNFTLDQFQPSFEKLFRQLKCNKARYGPITSLPRHGITAECARSNVSAELYNDWVENYISAGVNARIEAAKAAKQEIEEKYEKKFGKDFGEKLCFSDELDDLGGIRHEDSHIAIVHIDGNDIGERFKQAPSLTAIRALSKTVNEATEAAFDAVVKTAKDRYRDIMDSLGFDPRSGDHDRRNPTEYKLNDDSIARLEKEARFPQKYLEKLQRLKNQGYGGRSKFLKELQRKLKTEFSATATESLIEHASKRDILPIRPIILGGDDVTFVCDGKLGIYFAKIFIEEFEKVTVDSEKLTACAGVAIIKTRYPFYRGYKLAADELCIHAKRVRKKSSSTDSFLDFHVSLGGIAGTLSEIRRRDFGEKPEDEGKAERNLLYRPFKIVPKAPFDELSLEMFLEKVRQLVDRDIGLPKTKLNELSEVLTLSEDAARKFVQALKYRGRALPEIEGHQYGETLFESNKTPYFDMIEILRFYPDFALQENGEKT